MGHRAIRFTSGGILIKAATTSSANLIRANASKYCQPMWYCGGGVSLLCTPTRRRALLFCRTEKPQQSAEREGNRTWYSQQAFFPKRKISTFTTPDEAQTKNHNCGALRRFVRPQSGAHKAASVN